MNRLVFIIVFVAVWSHAVSRNLVHATYMIGGNVKEISFVDKVNFKQFDYIYLMAAPAWNKVDFSQSSSEIDRALVDSYRYPEDKGRAVIPYFIEKAHENNTKVLISFAGEGFMERVKDNVSRARFVDFMVKFMNKYRYDGIEVDWESDFDYNLHVTLMSELRTKLDSISEVNGKRLYLTTALHSWRVYSKDLADRLSSYVDWVNIMTYDMGGGIWGHRATHNTPLDQMERELEGWKEFDGKKLCIGFANYGFKYNGIKPGEEVPEKLDKYGCYFSYNKLLPLLDEGWTEVYDDKSKVSYYFSPDRSSFVTMENEKTIRTKIEWMQNNDYLGIFWWEFTYDMVVPERNGDKIKHHLIDIVRN